MPSRDESRAGAGRWLVALLPLAVFLGLVGFFWASLSHDPAALPSALINQPAPDFNLPPLRDDKPGLARADLLGHGPVLVNFFASWCAPCRQEHAVLAGFAASGGIPLYGVVYEDKPEAARRFLDELGDPYGRIGMDRDGRAGIDFGVYGVPETYLIDSGGRIRYRLAGALTPEILTRDILPLLASLKD